MDTMKELMKSFLNGTVSRRAFLKRMMNLGFTMAAANSMLGSLLSVESAPMSQVENYKSIVGSGGMLMVEQLKAAGVEYVFTNPGSYEVGFFDAFLHTPGMQHIMGLHEGIVISLADGYHKVTRKPAFVNVHVIEKPKSQDYRLLKYLEGNSWHCPDEWSALQCPL